MTNQEVMVMVLREKIEKIKTDIENLSIAYRTDYSTGEEYEYLDREEVLQILDEYIKENK